MKTRVKRTTSRRIPPPPTPEDGYDAIIEYFQKYTPAELDRSGHLKTPTREEIHDHEQSAAAALRRQAELRLQLSESDFKELSRLAGRTGAGIESLATRWLRQRIREERGRHSLRAVR